MLRQVHGGTKCEPSTAVTYVHSSRQSSESHICGHHSPGEWDRPFWCGVYIVYWLHQLQDLHSECPSCIHCTWQFDHHHLDLYLFMPMASLWQDPVILTVHAVLSGAGVDLSCYAGHSFWISLATSATQAGLSDSLIQILDRWRSTAFQWYIRTPTNRFLSICHTLVHARATQQGQTKPGYNTA